MYQFSKTYLKTSFKIKFESLITVINEKVDQKIARN